MRLTLFAARRPRTAARFVASAAALVLVAAQFGSYAHLLVTRHQLCAEHGELVESHDGPPAPAVVSVEAAGGSRLAPSSRTATGHQHEHCAMAPHRRERIVGTERHQILSAVQPTGSGHRWAVATVVAARDAVYRLAPKTSPPA
jgi:hypothetical protein